METLGSGATPTQNPDSDHSVRVYEAELPPPRAMVVEVEDVAIDKPCKLKDRDAGRTLKKEPAPSRERHAT